MVGSDTSTSPPSLGEVKADHMPALPRPSSLPAQTQLAGKAVVKRYRQVTYPPATLLQIEGEQRGEKEKMLRGMRVQGTSKSTF